MAQSPVSVTSLAGDSALHRRLMLGDYLDCHSVAADMPPRRAAEIITDFPGWARYLLVIRWLVTAPFGLDNDGPDIRDRIGIFPVESDTETELIAGFNDRHLDFRVAVRNEGGRVSLATWVHPHNLGGKVYLRLTLPFHILIVRNALARVAASM